MSNTMFFTLTDWGTIRKQNNLFEGLKKKKKRWLAVKHIKNTILCSSGRSKKNKFKLKDIFCDELG